METVATRYLQRFSIGSRTRGLRQDRVCCDYRIPQIIEHHRIDTHEVVGPSGHFLLKIVQIVLLYSSFVFTRILRTRKRM